ncbi:MAG: endonuclease/exonuclease/phosphatase family protein [Verrucomicrobiota bacterium]
MAANTMRFASFNLYNLVLPGETYYEDREYSRADYDRKTDWIARQLDRMDAGVIGFQEVFHSAALLEAVHQSGMTDAALWVKGDGGTYPVVGLASRYPVLGEAESIASIPEAARFSLEAESPAIDSFSRPILRATINLPEIGPTRFYVVHLKSKRGEYLEDESSDNHLHRAKASARALFRRTVEAVGLRQLLLEDLAGSNTPVVVLGDLNDEATAVTSSIVAGDQPWRFDPLEKKEPFFDRALYNVMDFQARRSLGVDQYTYIYNGYHQSLDHVFVSREFDAANPNHKAKVEYVRVFNDHLIDRMLSSERVPSWQSDHAQVVATIRPGGRNR